MDGPKRSLLRPQIVEIFGDEESSREVGNHLSVEDGNGENLNFVKKP